MLVLSRRPGERITVGGDITVTVLQISGGQVRLGIEAPPEVPILRDDAVKTTKTRREA
jgi:carbon storage regulator